VDRAISIGELIEGGADRLGITRLCHLTPLRNLLHIASGEGLLSVAQLEGERAIFDQQDLNRYDNHPDFISCSIEYPNVWYLRKRHKEATPLQRLFPEWVCLLIDRKYLWHPSTEFCPRNAAASGGSLLRPGYEAFCELYAEQVTGAQGISRGRDAKPKSCPTDDQAEVMIHRHIPLADANTIVFADEEQATNNLGALRLLGVPFESLDFLICPAFFEIQLSSTLRSGQIPAETPWAPPEDDGAT
jgi:ssDNA thymidine ADP-ribosyltransferase, DarT